MLWVTGGRHLLIKGYHSDTRVRWRNHAIKPRFTNQWVTSRMQSSLFCTVYDTDRTRLKITISDGNFWMSIFSTQPVLCRCYCVTVLHSLLTCLQAQLNLNLSGEWDIVYSLGTTWAHILSRFEHCSQRNSLRVTYIWKAWKPCSIRDVDIEVSAHQM